MGCLLRIPIVGGYVLFLTWRLSSFLTFSHILLNNSVTVKARAAKFKIPRLILPGKVWFDQHFQDGVGVIKHSFSVSLLLQRNQVAVDTNLNNRSCNK